MSFFECEFPTKISYGAQGGPSFSTTVNPGFSGYEQRNQNWAYPLGRWKISLTAESQDYFQAVYDFWLNIKGKADGFRLKDHKDYKATGQVLAALGGKTFQLQRTYGAGSRSYVKPIKKPITSAVEKCDGTYCEDTVIVYVSDNPLPTNQWSLDATTGIISIPGYSSGVVKADFQFHYPVRFDNDECLATIVESNIAEEQGLIEWPGLELVELRNP